MKEWILSPAGIEARKELDRRLAQVQINRQVFKDWLMEDPEELLP